MVRRHSLLDRGHHHLYTMYERGPPPGRTHGSAKINSDHPGLLCVPGHGRRDVNWFRGVGVYVPTHVRKYATDILTDNPYEMKRTDFSDESQGQLLYIVIHRSTPPHLFLSVKIIYIYIHKDFYFPRRNGYLTGT